MPDYLLYILIISEAVLIVVLALFALRSRKKNHGDDVFEGHKSEFLALTAHYFLTPLAIIRGNLAELLSPSAGKLNPTQVQVMHITMQAQVEKLLLLLQNITTTTGIDSGKLQLNVSTVNLVDAIQNCITEVHAEAMQKQLQVAFTVPEGPFISQISLDSEKFRQAMLNILSNAVKFTNNGGVIQVTLAESPNEFLVTVADSGVGIKASEMGLLFTRFHRGSSYLNMDYEGIGLGLYLAKYLIEVNKGTILVQSKEGKGTIVTVRLKR